MIVNLKNIEANLVQFSTNKFTEKTESTETCANKNTHSAVYLDLL